MMVLDGLDADVERRSDLLQLVDPRAICRKISASRGDKRSRIDRPPAIASKAIAREMSALSARPPRATTRIASANSPGLRALGDIAARAGLEGLEGQGSPCNASSRPESPRARIPLADVSHGFVPLARAWICR